MKLSNSRDRPERYSTFGRKRSSFTSKWEIILILLVIIAGIVITTIAAIKAKDATSLEYETNVGRLDEVNHNNNDNGNNGYKNDDDYYMQEIPDHGQKTSETNNVELNGQITNLDLSKHVNDNLNNFNNFNNFHNYNFNHNLKNHRNNEDKYPQESSNIDSNSNLSDEELDYSNDYGTVEINGPSGNLYQLKHDGLPGFPPPSDVSNNIYNRQNETFKKLQHIDFAADSAGFLSFGQEIQSKNTLNPIIKHKIPLSIFSSSSSSSLSSLSSPSSSSTSTSLESSSLPSSSPSSLSSSPISQIRHLPRLPITSNKPSARIYPNGVAFIDSNPEMINLMANTFNRGIPLRIYDQFRPKMQTFYDGSNIYFNNKRTKRDIKDKKEEKLVEKNEDEKTAKINEKDGKEEKEDKKKKVVNKKLSKNKSDFLNTAESGYYGFNNNDNKDLLNIFNFNSDYNNNNHQMLRGSIGNARILRKIRTQAPFPLTKNSYGILGSGNFEIIRGGVFENDDHKVRSLSNYINNEPKTLDYEYEDDLRKPYSTDQYYSGNPVLGFQGYDNFNAASNKNSEMEINHTPSSSKQIHVYKDYDLMASA